MTDFMSAAFPWVALGLALAVWAAVCAKKAGNPKPKDADKTKSR